MEPTRTGRDTADTIQQAAIKLIHSKGYHGTSIRDIARESNVGIATLFHHFGSKAELLERTLKNEFDYLLGQMEAAIERVDDPLERFAAAVRVHVVLHCQKPESAIVNTELRSLEPVPRAEVQVKVERVQAIFTSTLLAGVKARRFGCARPRETARAVHGMCSSVTSWYHLGAGMTPEDVGELYVELALRLAQAVPVKGTAVKGTPVKGAAATGGRT